MLKNFKKISTFSGDTKIYPGHEYAASNYAFGIFIETDNEKLKARYEWAQKTEICVPSTVQIEMDTNVFMRTANKTVVDNLKTRWKEAGAKIGKVGGRYAVKVGGNLAKWEEKDIIGGLRHLKTSGFHKSAKM